MKILKILDAKKIAKAKNKILLAIISILFFALLLWSLAFREFVSNHPGLIGVLIAVSGEVYFDWKKESGRDAKWKKFFMALLVVSLAYELYEASESDKKAADAIKLAGLANESAGKSNERAANTESNNLALRTKVLELEAKMQPRSISKKQISDFIFLTDKIPKIPIRVGVGPTADEVFTFAVKVQTMLADAGYNVPDSDKNEPLGIHQDLSAISWYNATPSISNIWPDICFITDITNDLKKVSFNFEYTNGYARPIVFESDTNKIYAALTFVFQQIGIIYVTSYKPDWVKPNHCEIFINQRLY